MEVRKAGLAGIEVEQLRLRSRPIVGTKKKRKKVLGVLISIDLLVVRQTATRLEYGQNIQRRYIYHKIGKGETQTASEFQNLQNLDPN